jgi:hypothetical protein
MGGRADLGGDDDVVSQPAKMLDCAAHYFLGFTACVALGAVEKVDASVVGRFEAGKGLVVADVAAVCEPAPEGYGRNLETTLADEAVLHLWKVFGCFLLRHCEGRLVWVLMKIL